VIEQAAFACEPWAVVEESLSEDLLAQSESVFTLANGHIGLRGNLDEGEPHGLPGTYLGGFYELRPLPSAEKAYGEPESSQTVVNVTNGKLIRLLVDDEPFDVRYGQLEAHRRVLDLRAGTLAREVRWCSPGRRRVAVRSLRLVSLTQRAIAAIRYEVTALDEPVRVVLQSELVANEELPGGGERSRASGDLADPRSAGVLADPLVAVRHAAEGCSGLLVHRSAVSGLTVAAMMDHELTAAPDDHEILAEASEDRARTGVIARLAPGERLCLVKYLAYGWSAQRSTPALEDQVAGAVHAARHSGFDGLLSEQRRTLDEFWAGADVEVDGDPAVQQAVRCALFHVLQAGVRAETRAIPAKGLTGSGYDGHAFWDTETFVLPVLSATAPDAAADALRWRHATLPQALERARRLGLGGAAFPWRSIHGEESSGYWPASTAAFHVNADVADALLRHLALTGDDALAAEIGVDLLVHTARLWVSLGHHDDGRGFRIDGVTGPDEYSAVADNNVYTNLMARRNLRAAADLAEAHPDVSAGLGVGADELAAWRAAADAMVVPFDTELGVHPQADGFTRHQRWDWERTGEDDYPLMLHFPYFDLYRKQVTKQADLVLALYVCGEDFTPEQKAADFAYYEALTVRDSSLSAAVQAIVAAEVGHLDLAYDYLGEAALMDLEDLEHNTRDGLHMASLAGSWLALVAGIGGMRIVTDLRAETPRLDFAPRLPAGLEGLRFRLRFRGTILGVAVDPTAATYRLLGPEGAAAVRLTHYGEELAVAPGRAERRAIPALRAGPAPFQPPGRAPRRRTPGPGPQARASGGTRSAHGADASSSAARE